MMKLFTPLFLLLAGCGTAPYVEFGVGYQINQISDPYYTILAEHPKGNQLGQPWVFQGEVGVEGPSLRCGWQHESRLLDGGPWNNKPELYREMIRCSKKFGGYK